MKGAPTTPDQKTGPFPLEANLRRLKPSLARLGPLIAGVSILASQGEFWDAIENWLGTTEGWVVLGLLTVVALFFFADLFLKQIWFNERGIGIAMPWGGSKTWYPFDTLKAGQFKMKKRRRSSTMTYTPAGRLSLNFHTGSVRLWPSLYDTRTMNDLLAVLSRRFPNQFQAPPPTTAEEDATDTAKTDTDTQSGEKKEKKGLFGWNGSTKKTKDTSVPGTSTPSKSGGSATTPKPGSTRKSKAEQRLEQLLNRGKKK